MILITGATGRTGKEAAQQLVAKGATIRMSLEAARRAHEDG